MATMIGNENQQEQDSGASPLWPIFAVFGLVFKLGFLLAFALLLAGVVGMASYLFLTKKVQGEIVEVPTLVREDVTSALDELNEMGLSMELIHIEYGAQSPAGIIINQRPVPKTQVKKGSTVHVTLSGGPMNVVVPDLKNLVLNEAKVNLEKSDLKIGEITSIPDMKAPVGAVIASEPPSGASVVRFAPINLLVSIGQPPAETSMPSLIGQTPEAAETIFSSLGLKMRISEIQEAERRDRSPGVIIEQSPKPGTRVSPEAAVMVTVAKAPAS